MEYLPTIHLATATHSDILAALGASLFRQAYGDVKNAHDIDEYCLHAFVAKDIAADIETQHAHFFMAYLQREPVGYTKLRCDRTMSCLPPLKCIELERIYVARDYWRHHIGHRLMDNALQFAKAQGFQYLWLGVWQLNTRAVDFYNKYGFEIIGTKKFYVGTEENDDFVMGIKV